MPLSDRPTRLAIGLAVVNGADAVACAIPVKAIEDDLIRIGCPKPLRQAIPIVKGAATAGLLVGFRNRRLGRATSKALVVYYVLAVAAHVRVKDSVARHVPAAGLLAASVVAASISYRD